MMWRRHASPDALLLTGYREREPRTLCNQSDQRRLKQVENIFIAMKKRPRIKLILMVAYYIAILVVCSYYGRHGYGFRLWIMAFLCSPVSSAGPPTWLTSIFLSRVAFALSQIPPLPLHWHRVKLLCSRPLGLTPTYQRHALHSELKVIGRMFRHPCTADASLFIEAVWIWRLLTISNALHL